MIQINTAFLYLVDKVKWEGETFTCRFSLHINHDIEFGAARVVDHADQASGLILDDTNSEMLVPHAVDAYACLSHPLHNLGPRGIAFKIHAVFDLEFMG